MIASVQLPNDDAQFDASHYDSEKGGRNLKGEGRNDIWVIFFVSLNYNKECVQFDKVVPQVRNKITKLWKA